jgi:hypothetical protein
MDEDLRRSMQATRTVILASIGLCEHCGTLLSFQDMPFDAMNAEWKCSQCNGILTENTFGYRTVVGEDGKPKGEKVRWVGPDGKWTDQKPTEDFILGTWQILINPPHYYWI